jgi:hypothetical protein
MANSASKSTKSKRSDYWFHRVCSSRSWGNDAQKLTFEIRWMRVSE